MVFSYIVNQRKKVGAVDNLKKMILTFFYFIYSRTKSSKKKPILENEKLKFFVRNKICKIFLANLKRSCVGL